jgi:hypothetical protein
MSAMDDAVQTLTDDVTADETVEGSAVTLLSQLSDLLLQFKDSPQKIVDLAGRLKTQSDALAAAVVANTPAAPAA